VVSTPEADMVEDLTADAVEVTASGPVVT